MRRRRPAHPRRTRIRILIQCEGSDTESNYLRGVRALPEVDEAFVVDVKSGRGGDARAVVKAAMDARKKAENEDEKYDNVWCVLDVEDRSRTDALTEALIMARREGIKVFLSNPSFEVWLLAHFERATRYFTDSNTVKAHLQSTHWRRHFGCDYDKSDPQVYDKMAGRLDIAIENAEWTLTQGPDELTCRDRNSSTEVGRLIVRLRSAP